MGFVFYARPHLLSSPPGEEIVVGGFGFADNCPVNSVAGFSKRQQMIVLLLGET
jgi:hypothetical protein